ncbi:MAG: hypothetical protein C0623_08010 [Desulfuromonas sp.]|nr:MAG: hypothetical protein C0623_08010 [Desulfuromonas sp.]
MRKPVVIFAVKIFLCVALILFLSACFSNANQIHSGQAKSTDAKAKTLLVEPLPLHRFELSTEALTVWRQYSTRKPTLLLLSKNPMLNAVPEPLVDGSYRLAKSGSSEDLRRYGNLERPDTLLLPSMTVRVAMDLGWFGEFIWVRPNADLLNLEQKERLQGYFSANGLAFTAEQASLEKGNRTISGVLSNTPASITALSLLDELKGPIIVHIDQNWFLGKYKNEVATPILSLVLQTLNILRDRGVQALAVTFASNNLDGTAPLEYRFLKDFLLRYIEQPDNLDQTPPDIWRQLGENRYLANFFKEELIQKNTSEMIKNGANTAWVKYYLYRTVAARGDGVLALAYLEEAVALDRIYAIEYLHLARMAYDKGFPTDSMHMLKKAAMVFPDIPEIQIRMVRLALEMKSVETASRIIKHLIALPWSPVYYGNMPKYLEGLADQVASLEEPSQQAPGKSAASSAHRPILE